MRIHDAFLSLLSALLVAAAVASPGTPALAADAPAIDPVPGLLYDETSLFERVIVVDEGGYRYLRFGSLTGDDQSVLNLTQPDLPVLEYIPRTCFGMALAEDHQRALVVGFGAGSTTRFWHGLYPQMRIDSVEIDALVVAVAYQFFLFPFDILLPVHVMDGRAWVQESPGDYDVVLLDAYGAGDAPYHLTTLEFYAEVQDKLAPGGVVIANTVADLHSTVLSLERTFREAFPTVYRLETPNDGNVLLVGTQGTRLSDEEIRARLQHFATEHLPGISPDDLGVPVPAPGGVTGATVFRDRPAGRP